MYFYVVFIWIIYNLFLLGIYGSITVFASAWLLHKMSQSGRVKKQSFVEASDEAFKTALATSSVVWVTGVVSCFFVSVYYQDLWIDEVKATYTFVLGGLLGGLISALIIGEKYKIGWKRTALMSLAIWIFQMVMLSVGFYLQLIAQFFELGTW